MEFKEILTPTDRLSAEMVAFSNAQGGQLLIGINDDGNIEGLRKEEVKKFREQAMNKAANSCKPPINVWTEVITVTKKSVLVIHIPKGVALHRDGKHEVWVRSGLNERRVTDNAELSRLMQEKGLIYADRQIMTTAGIDDLDTASFKRFYKTRFDREMGSDEGEVRRILKNMKLLRDDRPTLTSLLLFGIHNEYTIPQFCIKAIWFYTDECITTRYRSSVDIHGTLVDQYKAGKDFIVSKLNNPQGDKDFNSTGDLEIPELVIKELLINALFHRDYFIADSIKLYLFPNRIEIKSPGRLPNSLTVGDIRQGIQRRDSNILITSYANDLLPYRGIGSGILNSLKVYPSIDFENDVAGDFFKVTIHRPRQ